MYSFSHNARSCVKNKSGRKEWMAEGFVVVQLPMMKHLKERRNKKVMIHLAELGVIMYKPDIQRTRNAP